MCNRTFSRSQLLKAGGETEQLEQAKRFIALKAHELKERGERLLVGADKKVRAQLTGETEEELKRTSGRALGADIAHFANIRGSNDFKDHNTIIVLGRDQPKLEDAEQLAMAIYFDTTEPLQFAERDAKGQANYSLVEREYQMRDGSRVKGKVLVHLDPRIQAVVEQVREAGMLQMIDRLRLLHHDGAPKEVIILCSVPLDIEVDRLVTWEELAGNQKLNKILDMNADEGFKALPLSSVWLAHHFPEVFKTPKAAKNWLEYAQVAEIIERASKPENAISTIRMGNSGFENSVLEPEVVRWRGTRFRLAKQRGGRPSRALVQEGCDPTAAITEALGVSAEAIIVLDEPPALGSPESPMELKKPVWNKPLSFAAMLRPDEEGDGVLLTELVCQSEWSPTQMLPQRALH